MRTTYVPAQITTVEDRIAGNLGMSQLVLLFIPVIFGSLLYVILPPGLHASAYKLIILTLLAISCVALAIRIKGRLVLFWIAILLRYWLRPRYYVFDKRSLHGRARIRAAEHEAEEITESEPVREQNRVTLPIADLVSVHELLEGPITEVVYETRKGGLHVRIIEARQEG